MLIRSPVKTLLTVVLLAAVMFALLSRVSEYAVTAEEFNSLAKTYHGIGIVEATPPVLTDFTWSEFLTSNKYNPDNPDGTWENTRYEALTAQQMDFAAALRFVTNGSVRYMTAGVSDIYKRPLDPGFHNYTDRGVIAGDLSTVTYRRYGAGALLPDVAFLRGEARILIRNTTAYAGNVEDDQLDTALMPTYFEGAYFDPVVFEQMQGLTLQIVNRTRMLTSLLLSFDDWEETMIHGERYLIVGRLGSGVFNKWIYAGDSLTEHRTDVIFPLGDRPDNFLETDEFAYIRELIDIIRQDLYTFDIVYVDSLSSIARFNYGAMGIVEGRAITAEDDGSLVCVISSDFAMHSDLSVGDKVRFSLGDKLFEQHAGLGALAVSHGRHAKPVKEVELEIVGIYENTDSIQSRGYTAHWSYSAATVFVPLSLLPESADIENMPIKPGSFSIVIEDARNISAFLHLSLPLLEEKGLKLHFFDGGWLEIEKDFLLTQWVSLIAIVALVLAAMAAVILAVYIFILQKKKDFATMRATGCTKKRAYLALFVPLITVAAAGVALGSITAWGYSIYAESAVVSIPVILLCAIGFLLFLCIASTYGLWRVSTLAPLALLQNTGNLKRKKLKKSAIAAPGAVFQAVTPAAIIIPPLPKGNIFLSFLHCIKYILRNIRRAWLKSVLTVFVAGILFGAAGQFAVVRHQARILFDTMPITLSMRGMVYAELLNKQLLPSELVLTDTGYKETVGFTFWTGPDRFRYIGDTIWVGGKQATLVVTSDIERYYGVPVEIEHTEGRQYTSWSHYPAAMSSSLMDALGISLGDPVYVFHGAGDSWYDADLEIMTRVTTNSEIGDYTVFFPPESLVRRQLLLDHYTYAEYLVADNYRISELRELLARYMMPLGITCTINTEELDRVKSNLVLYDMFFPMVATALTLIGGLLPAMMILSVSKDASLLRALGTTKKRTRFILLSGQLILCFSGLILGFAVLMLYNGRELLEGISEILQQYVILCSISYVIAAVICAILVTRRNVLELLQTKE